MTRRLLTSALLACALLGGCASIQVGTGLRPLHTTGATASDPDNTWRLDISNWGLTLFGSAPLVSGSVDQVGRMTWFTDTVNSEGMTRLLADAALALGATELVEVETKIVSSWALGPFWFIDGFASATVVGPPDVHEIPPLLPSSAR